MSNRLSRYVENAQKNEDGFSLVELLVVILVIGILASIAVPVFLHQRKVANDAAVESDIKSAAAAVETYFLNNKDAPGIDLNEIKKLMSKSSGTVITFHGTSNDFCLTGKHENGKKYLVGLVQADNNNLRPYVLYSNKDGGFIPTNGSVLTGRSCNVNGSSW